MSEQPLIYEKANQVAYITLNRPAVLNAIDMPMRQQLEEALADFDRDPEVWVAIVAANGGDFCVGADLRTGGMQNQKPILPPSKSNHYLLDRPANWKPVVAAVQGKCYGQGLSFVAECDVIIASKDASFCMIETKRAMPPVTIAAQLAAWMGSKKVTEMILTGDPLPAQDAHRLGLVNQLVPTVEELRPAALELARRILRNPPLAVRTAVQATRTWALDSRIHREAEMLFRNAGWQDTDDFRESISAFLERRTPLYRGK